MPEEYPQRRANLFKKVFYTYAQHFHAVRRMELAKIKSYLENKGDKTILDLGCGKGFFCSYLYRKNNRVYGIDPSEKDIALAHCVHPHITFNVGYGETLPYADEYFDTVVSVCALEHMQDDGTVLKEVYRVLKKDGIFVLSVDSLSSHYISKAYTAYHIQEYTVHHLYDKKRIHDLLTEAGFTGLECEYLYDSYCSSLILRFGSFFHFRSLFILAFPFMYPILLLDDWLHREKNGGFILVVKAQK
jgi:ubiquinone/menaquinone biosynthesis C-methylase UbiE